MTFELQALFRDVADLSAAERQVYFDRMGVPPPVRAEVELLLRFDGEGEPLGERIAAAAMEFLQSGAAVEAGDRCGKYVLLRPLGEGGMGRVFLARRDDGEVEQQVAIKFVLHAGRMPSFLNRFLEERRILASLSHPGIARLLDAGHTPAGQPYLVMDYVDGTPIDAYVAKLALREKLELFLRVCDAISYAHRNLVIHRDLKPSNILVEASGQPKLLDFGIARVLDETEAANEGATIHRMLTPGFASPEQARGTARTTATDIYSLGALLYVLLTRQLPHSIAGEAGPSMESLICDAEPARPSSLDRALPRDLDFVVEKALRKEPEERYPAVDALAEDVRAVLESRPVRARSGTLLYRSRKFARRHWLPVLAVTAAVVSLILGLYATNRERAIAQHRFLQLRQLSNRMLALDADVYSLPGSTKIRGELVAASMEYLEGLSREAGDDRDLAMDLARGYMHAARVQGVPAYPNLGQFAAAEQSLRQAEFFAQKVLAAAPGQIEARLIVAESAQDRMMIADSEQRSDEALRLARACTNELDVLLKVGGATPRELTAAARLYINTGQAYMNMHLFEEAARYTRKGIGIASRDDVEIPAGLSLLANILRQTGNLDGALDAILSARKLAETAKYSSEVSRNATVYAILWRYGLILGEDDSISLNRPAEALVPLRADLETVDRLAAKDLNDTTSRDRVGTVGRTLADILRHTDPRGALAVYDQALQRLREIKNSVKARHGEVLVLARSSYVLRQLRRVAEARERIDVAFRLLRELKEYPAEQVGLGKELDVATRALADHEAETRHAERATAIYRELLAKVLVAKPEPERDLHQANDLSRIYRELARLERWSGHTAEAADMKARWQALWLSWDRTLPNNAFVRRQLAESLGS